MVSRISFSGKKNVEYATTGSHGTLNRVSQEIEKTYFQATKINKINATKARYLLFEDLMTVEESHFQVGKMPKSALHEASSPGVKDFTTRQ
jgi:hypothetical protein